MNTSYKIGLVVAVILLTLVIGYQVTRPGDDAPTTTADTNTADQALAQPDTPAAPASNGPASPAVDPHSADALPPPPTQDPAPTRSTNANPDRPLLGPADFLSRRVPSTPTTPTTSTPTSTTPPTTTSTTTPTLPSAPSNTTAEATPSTTATPRRTTTPSITLGNPTTPTTPTTTTTRTTDASPTRPTLADGPSTPATTTTTTPDFPAARTYTVQPRDNFWVIADRLYDDPKYWSVIAQANPTVDPTKIKPGDELRLPTRQALAEFDASSEPPPVPTAPTGGRTYTVRAGDSLTLISQRVYGSARYFRRIHAANRQLIGDSPDNIREGMVLQLPAIDTSGS
ncbi:MAG: LysM peptidoglycan-binding domain-containing protein [Planctomycetota bacterium]